jgi:hypothetical protein
MRSGKQVPKSSRNDSQDLVKGQFQGLKDKQRAMRDGFPDGLALRVHRALSWLGRAESEHDDDDIRFILLWVGFNSAYAFDVSAELASERGVFRSFFETLVFLDGDRRIYNAVWQRFSQEIRLLLSNKYVYQPFWNHHNGVPGYDDWADKLASSQRLSRPPWHSKIRPESFRSYSTGYMSYAISSCMEVRPGTAK